MTARKNGAPGAQRPTLRELEVFRSVILCGKTTAAASQLGISQPAVSRAISQLEARRDEILFHRVGNRLVPTSEALALNQELEPVFEVLARVALGPAERGRARVLRIVAPASFSEYFLPSATARFMQLQQDCAINLEIGATPTAVASVASGLADLGLTNSRVSHAGARLIPFRTSRACCVVPSAHALARLKTITAADLHEQPFIALARRFSSRALIDRLFEEAGVRRRIVAEAATAVAAMALVRHGLGVSILNPFPISECADGALSFRAFEPAITHESSFILPIGQVKPEARQFIETVTSSQDIATSA